MCRTVKQLLDAIEQARAGDFDEPQPSRGAPSLSGAPPQPASSSSMEGPRRQLPAESTLQPMRGSQGMQQSAKPGLGASGASLGALSNGDGGVPSWIGAPTMGGSGAAGMASSAAGGSSLSGIPKATAGRASNNLCFWSVKQCFGHVKL